MADLMMAFLHMCQYLFTAYFRKMLSFEMLFIRISVVECFQTFIKTHPRKKLERAVDGAPSQIPTLKSLTPLEHPAA